MKQMARLLTAMITVCSSAVVIAEPTPPSSGRSVAGEWAMEVVHCTDGKMLRGLIQEPREGELELVEVVRPEGKPMYLVIRPLERDRVQRLQRLEADQRKELQARIYQFRYRSRFEARRMDKFVLTQIAGQGTKRWFYTGRWFTLESEADEEFTRRCIGRVEQVFRAFRQLLPSRTSAATRPHVVIYASMDAYHRQLQRIGLALENPAFYSLQDNRIVAGSDLAAFAERLAQTRKRNAEVRLQLEQVDQQMPARLATIRQQLLHQGVSAALVRQEMIVRRNAWNEEQQALLRELSVAERTNDVRFAEVTNRMFRRLYHEAFHAYLENHVYPRRNWSVPRWLNEGLAQVFESGRLEGDTLRIDAPNELVLASLQRDLRASSQFGLAELLTSDESEFLVAHSGTGFASLRHYAYSWGLAYYLCYHQPLLDGERFQEYLRAEDRPLDLIARFEQLVGMRLNEFEPRWREGMLQASTSR